MSDRGCAQGSDGELLSPSKIKWYNDADDTTPILDPPPALPTSSAKLIPSTLDRFLTGTSVIASATPVAGARRSGRAFRPSAKVADPNNAESSASAAKRSLKRKATTTQPLRTRKVVLDSDDDSSSKSDEDDDLLGDDLHLNIESVGTETGGITTDDGEEAEQRYMSTKSLGDLDRNVSEAQHIFFVV
jgi:hypothetical protein